MSKKNRKKGQSRKKRGDLPFFGWAIVGFFDLLGFSSSVFSDWNNLDRSPVDRLLKIKAAPGIGTRGIAIQAHEGQGGVPIGQQFLPVVHSVSDSVTLSVPLPQQTTARDLVLAFLSICANARFVWQAAVLEGFVVRGGIELGQIYLSASEIIGPALINAIKIEGQVAEIARVVLGPKVLDALSRLGGEFDAVKPFLMKSEDGLVALNPGRFVASKETSSASFLEHVRELRDRCVRDDHKIKYDELLNVLSEPESVCEPSIADLDASRFRFHTGVP